MTGINILNKTEIMEYTYEQHIFVCVLLIVWIISAMLIVIGLICSSKWPLIVGGILFLISNISMCTVDLEKSKNTGR